MELNVASCLAEGQLTIEQILIDEARHLCESSPISNVVNHPTASKSALTEKAKMGVGPAHCVVRRWPPHTTPSEWGRRNENLLLRQIITLDIWTRLGPNFNSIKRRVESTRLESMRANDDGNEEEYRNVIELLMGRLYALAFLFFLNEWLKPENLVTPDYEQALKALQSFGVKAEFTNQDGTIRNDVGVVIPNSDMLHKTFGKKRRLVCISNMNAKNTGQTQFSYQTIDSPTLPNINSVDQAMTVGLNVADTENMTITSLRNLFHNQYQLKIRKLEWPLFALSHFAQMSYESSETTSSMCLFTSLWGFLRCCYREERPGDIPILYVTDNTSVNNSNPEDRTDEAQNLSIVTQLYYAAILTIKFSFRRITPPTLREDREFCSHIQGYA